MDLKSFGVALGGFGAVVGLSLLRLRSASLAEEDEEAPMTYRPVAPEVLDRYERAYRKGLDVKSRDASKMLLDFQRQLRRVQDKIADCDCQSSAQEDLDEVVGGIMSTWAYLDTINFQRSYVDEWADMLAKSTNEPRDLARMGAYASYVQSLSDASEAEEFAREAGERDVTGLLARWGAADRRARTSRSGG
jgi:hypothetical protein